MKSKNVKTKKSDSTIDVTLNEFMAYSLRTETRLARTGNGNTRKRLLNINNTLNTSSMRNNVSEIAFLTFDDEFSRSAISKNLSDSLPCSILFKKRQLRPSTFMLKTEELPLQIR